MAACELAATSVVGQCESVLGCGERVVVRVAVSALARSNAASKFHPSRT